MVGVAAYHRAERNDRVVLAALRHLLGDKGQLKSTGHLGERNLCGEHAVAEQRILRAVNEAGDHKVVKARRDNADADFFGGLKI